MNPIIQLQKTDDDQTKKIDEAIPLGQIKRSQLAEARRIISARELQKLAKNDLPVFLAIVRANDSPNKQSEKRGKQSDNREARFATAHGLTKEQKRVMDKSTGPKKDIISVKERE